MRMQSNFTKLAFIRKALGAGIEPSLLGRAWTRVAGEPFRQAKEVGKDILLGSKNTWGPLKGTRKHLHKFKNISPADYTAAKVKGGKDADRVRLVYDKGSWSARPVEAKYRYGGLVGLAQQYPLHAAGAGALGAYGAHRFMQSKGALRPNTPVSTTEATGTNEWS